MCSAPFVIKRRKSMKKDIKYRNEKRYIMALYYKQRLDQDLSITAMYKRWQRYWPEDYTADEPDEHFKGDYRWIKTTINSKKLRQIISERQNAAPKNSRVPRRLQKLAKENGYMVKHGNCYKHPYSLSGYAVCTLKDDKLVYGKNFDLSYGEVVGYIQQQAEKKEKSNGKV